MEGYLTFAEIEKKYCIKRKPILKLIKENEIRAKYETGNTKIKWHINESDLIQCINQKKLLVGAYGNIPPGEYVPAYGYRCQYAVERKTGLVVDFTERCIVTPSKDERGYYKYKLAVMPDGYKTVPAAKFICNTLGLNNRRCEQIHHIDGNPANNRPSNLCPAHAGKEHGTLDKMRRAMKKDPTNEEAREAYMAEVKRIQKLNRERHYKIPHPDYSNTDCLTYWIELNKRGYQEYKKTGNILNDCILGEIVEVKKTDGGDTL